MKQHRILFVCMGNICRSPSAEGVFRRIVEDCGLSDQFEIDSAGTGGWHVGSPPDRRAQQAAKSSGIDLSTLRARQFTKTDFEEFDLIIAMDDNNLNHLTNMATLEQSQKIKLLLEFSSQYDEREVPDPYYGGHHGFEDVLDMIEDSCKQLLKALSS